MVTLKSLTNKVRRNPDFHCARHNLCVGLRSFGVQQLAAAFLPASGLAGISKGESHD